MDDREKWREQRDRILNDMELSGQHLAKSAGQLAELVHVARGESARTCAIAKECDQRQRKAELDHMIFSYKWMTTRAIETGK